MQDQSVSSASTPTPAKAETPTLRGIDSDHDASQKERRGKFTPEVSLSAAATETLAPRPGVADLQQLADEELIARAKQRDELAYGVLTARHRHALIGSIRVRLPDGRRDGRVERAYSAEDAASETEEIAWRKIDKYDASIGRFGPWLKGIARWVVFRHFGASDLGDDSPTGCRSDKYDGGCGSASRLDGPDAPVKPPKKGRGCRDYYRCEIAWSELCGRGQGGPSLYAGDDAIDAAQRHAERWLCGDDDDDLDDPLREICEPIVDGSLGRRNEQRAVEAWLRELAERNAAVAGSQYIEEDFRLLLTSTAASRRPLFQMLPWMMRRMFDLQPSEIVILARSTMEQLLIEASDLVRQHSALEPATIEEMLRPYQLELARPVAQVVRDKRTRVRLFERWVARGSIATAEEFFATPIRACRLCDFFAHANPAAAEIPHWIQTVDRSCGRSLPSSRRRPAPQHSDRTFTSFNPQHSALWAA